MLHSKFFAGAFLLLASVSTAIADCCYWWVSNDKTIQLFIGWWDDGPGYQCDQQGLSDYDNCEMTIQKLDGKFLEATATFYTSEGSLQWQIGMNNNACLYLKDSQVQKSLVPRIRGFKVLRGSNYHDSGVCARMRGQRPNTIHASPKRRAPAEIESGDSKHQEVELDPEGEKVGSDLELEPRSNPAKLRVNIRAVVARGIVITGWVLCDMLKREVENMGGEVDKWKIHEDDAVDVTMNYGGFTVFGKIAMRLVNGAWTAVIGSELQDATVQQGNGPVRPLSVPFTTS